MERITVLLADDNLIVREGVRALLAIDPAVEVVGTAGDYDELVARAVELHPQVLVTDIQMPPTFQDEGIEAVKEVRERLPGTGVVVLSQYDSPEYAVGLLADGAAGYAYCSRTGLPTPVGCRWRSARSLPVSRCSIRRPSRRWSPTPVRTAKLSAQNDDLLR